MVKYSCHLQIYYFMIESSLMLGFCLNFFNYLNKLMWMIWIIGQWVEKKSALNEPIGIFNCAKYLYQIQISSGLLCSCKQMIWEALLVWSKYWCVFVCVWPINSYGRLLLNYFHLLIMIRFFGFASHLEYLFRWFCFPRLTLAHIYTYNAPLFHIACEN